MTLKKDYNIYLNVGTKDLFDIIMISIDKSQEGTFYNPVMLQIYFTITTVTIFTDALSTLTEEDQKSDAFVLYDCIMKEKIYDRLAHDKNTKPLIDYMLKMIDKIVEEKTKENQSISMVVKNFLETFPKNAELAKEIVDTFDPQKYQEVVKFAEAANNGNKIK